MRVSRILLIAAVAAVAVGASALALHPPTDVPSAELSAPLFRGAAIDSATLRIFEQSCQDCHSQRTRLPWYGRLPPASWLLQRDVDAARTHMDLSQWDSYRTEEQFALLTAIGAVARTGVMPPQRYVLLHSSSRLSAAGQQQLYEWTRAEKARLARLPRPTQSPE